MKTTKKRAIGLAAGLLCMVISASLYADTTPQQTQASAARTSVAPSQFAIGKISLGMSLDKAMAFFGSPGQTGKDEHGGTYHAYPVSKSGGYLVLLTAPFRPSYVYGIQISGGSDVEMTPFLGVRLGDSTDTLIKDVGQPETQRLEAEGGPTLWTYSNRNYSFEVDKSGNLTSILVYGYEGIMTAMGWEASWELYQPNSIAQVIEDDRSCWEKTDVCVIAGRVRLRPRVVYSGEVVDTSPAVLEMLGHWMKSVPSNFTIDMFQKSIKVTEDGKEYWLPVQPAVLKGMQAEVKPGDSIDLFAIWAGAEHKGAVDAIIVNDYCFCEWAFKGK